MQTKRWSAVESVVNMASGLLLSIYVVQPIVFQQYGVTFSDGQNITIAVIFTVVSLVRGYITRRIFNWIAHVS